MIASLQGVVAEKREDEIVLDVAGIGYGLLVAAEDFGQLSAGERVKLYVYEHIRENLHDLYGFIRPDTRRLFESLLGVNGVGPKMALSILNIGSADEVRASIVAGDTRSIQRANGVGKRVAERIIVELKDKLGLAGIDIAATGLLQSEARLRQDEAVEALVSLGYSVPDAAAALVGVDAALSTETRVKQALRRGNV